MNKFIAITMMGILSASLAAAAEEASQDAKSVSEQFREHMHRNTSVVTGVSMAAGAGIEARRMHLEGNLKDATNALHQTRIYTDTEAKYLSNASLLREQVAQHGYEIQGNIMRQVQLDAEHKRVLAEISNIEKKIQPLEVRREISQRQREAIAIQMRIQQEIKPEAIAAAEQELKATYARIADLEHKISEKGLRRDLHNRMQHSLAIQMEQMALRKKDLEMTKALAELKSRSSRLNQAAGNIIHSHNEKAAPIAKKIDALLKDISFMRSARWGNLGLMGLMGTSAVITSNKVWKLSSENKSDQQDKDAQIYADRINSEAPYNRPESFLGSPAN